MIYVINHSETVPLRDVIVCKIFPNRFKEVITGKEINASIKMFKADTDTFEYYYYINKKIPYGFSKKDKRKNAKYENKIKALVKKYESK